MLQRFFHGVNCSGYRDLNKCQIPAHPGLNSCQMPGGCLGGMGTLGFDSYIIFQWTNNSGVISSTVFVGFLFNVVKNIVTI